MQPEAPPAGGMRRVASNYLIKMKPIFVFLLTTVSLLGAFFVLQPVIYSVYNNRKSVQGVSLKKLKVGNATFKVEVAEDHISRSQGLSGRENLPEDHGMIFVFENSRYHTFWMKGMKFPLDFIWIRNNEVVEVTENVQPLASPLPQQIIRPPQAVDSVLEINAGEAAEKSIRIGDNVVLQ